MKTQCNILQILRNIMFSMGAIVMLVMLGDAVWRFFWHKEVVDSIANVHYIALVVLTGVLAFVAWWQLSHIRDVGQHDFLLRIDERLSSDQIVKARTIIHQLSFETDRKKGTRRLLPKDADKIGEKIIKMREDKHRQGCSRGIYMSSKFFRFFGNDSLFFK
jgi:hypothetical protein